MNNKNITGITELFFLGFPNLGGFKVLIFLLILGAYSITVLLDVIIIILVSTRGSLHSPMYFFLKNFLFSEMFLVTVIVPNMLCIIWQDGAAISIAGCITQCYLSGVSGTCECYLLAAMSYDRFVAIRKPLHYNMIITNTLQYFLVILCWMLSLLLTVIILSFLVKLTFCDQNTINHFFCDLTPLVDLACSNTSTFQINILVFAFPVIIIPFILVVISYLNILAVILRMPTVLGRKKAFSTCSTHLLVVGLFYGSLIINYIIPVRGHSLVINKVISIIATVITPLFSPIIYSLRNQDMRAVILRYVKYNCKKYTHKSQLK